MELREFLKKLGLYLALSETLCPLWTRE